MNPEIERRRNIARAVAAYKTAEKFCGFWMIFGFVFLGIFQKPWFGACAVLMLIASLSFRHAAQTHEKLIHG